jgi:hypothetical protein
MVLGLTVDQLGFVASGFLLVLVISLAWSISKRDAFQRGYDSGTHDREHWETDEIVRGKLRRK